jgi:hypothetical protein
MSLLGSSSNNDNNNDNNDDRERATITRFWVVHECDALRSAAIVLHTGMNAVFTEKTLQVFLWLLVYSCL